MENPTSNEILEQMEAQIGLGGSISVGMQWCLWCLGGEEKEVKPDVECEQKFSKV